MHSYLGSIGFRGCTTVKQEKMLLDEVMHYANRKAMISSEIDETSMLAELSLDFANGMGITVCGRYDAEEHFHMDHYFPYLEGRNVTTNEEVFVDKHSGTDSFGALCEDYRLGVSMIFYLQNGIEYLRNTTPRDNSVNVPVRISGLASEGKILLPTLRTMQDIETTSAEITKHNKMIAEARNGNQEAIDKLTIQEIDTISDLGKRVKNEDVFSIVDTSFIPHGVESEVYKILGVILACEERANLLTEEVVYVMEVYCNHMIFDVCINKADLLGVPEVGRRIRALVWLQGHLDFPR